jgi:hypothetical protein
MSVVADADAVFGQTVSTRFPTLQSAAADLYANLDRVLLKAQPADRTTLLPVPQQAVAVDVDVALVQVMLAGLAQHFPDTDLGVCLRRDRWTFYLGAPHRQAGSGSTAADALTALMVGLLPPPTPDDLREILEIVLDQDDEHDPMEAESWSLERRWYFGLSIGALTNCLFRERFGLAPEQADLDDYATELYREALSMPSPEDELPPPLPVFSQLLAAMADPARTTWQRLPIEEHALVMLTLLGSLVRDRMDSGADMSALVDQAVQEGMLIARTVTESVERRD